MCFDFPFLKAPAGFLHWGEWSHWCQMGHHVDGCYEYLACLCTSRATGGWCRTSSCDYWQFAWSKHGLWECPAYGSGFSSRLQGKNWGTKTLGLWEIRLDLGQIQWRLTVWTPAGYLVTWQGYGHCLKVLKHATALLKAYNASKKSETLPEYTNAVAKYACMSKILSYLDTGKGIQDGHTCLVPEPLSLGKAAAAKTWQNAQNANKDDYEADDWLQQKMPQLWTRSLGFQWNDQNTIFPLFLGIQSFGYVSIYVYISYVHMYVWFYISVLVAVSISSIHCVQVFWKVNLFYHSGAHELKKPSPTFLFPLQVPFLEAASFPAGCLFPGCFQPQLFLREKWGFALRISVACWSLWMLNASQKIVIKRWLWRVSRWELVEFVRLRCWRW